MTSNSRIDQIILQRTGDDEQEIWKVVYLRLSITVCMHELLILEFTDETWDVTVLESAFRVVLCCRHTPSVTISLAQGVSHSIPSAQGHT